MSKLQHDIWEACDKVISAHSNYFPYPRPLGPERIMMQVDTFRGKDYWIPLYGGRTILGGTKRVPPTAHQILTKTLTADSLLWTSLKVKG